MTMTLSQLRAQTFFDQLQKFSDRYVRSVFGLLSATSPWGRPDLLYKRPIGAVIHYTADEDFLRVLRWFIDPIYNARVSAHAVVADRRWGSHTEMAKGLPMLATLPVTVIQIRPPGSIAWHATWMNSTAYGIENVNAGPSNETKSPFKLVTDVFGEPWVPYTCAQIRANVMLLRYVQQLYGPLRRPYILGHEHIQRSKRDPGPVYPLQGIRDAVLVESHPVGLFTWFQMFQTDHRYGQSYLDSVVVEYVLAVGSSNPNPSPAAAWARFESAVRALPDKDEFGLVGKTALRLLGYHADLSTLLDEDDLESVRLFQRMMKLKADSVPGPATKRALIARLEERRFLGVASERPQA